MTPDQIETAHALAQHPKCPEGLVQFVVSEATTTWRCQGCHHDLIDAVPWDDCSECGGGEHEVVVSSAVTVPDLSDSLAGKQNAGLLMQEMPRYWRVGRVGVPRNSTVPTESCWSVSKDPERRRGPDEQVAFLGESAAEALARGFVRGWSR